MTSDGAAMFEKVLIANRGEIALRIHRACHEMGIRTVAVHSTADAHAMHVRLADETVCIGPPPARASYLNVASDPVGGQHHRRRRDPSRSRVSAENADFAAAVEETGFTFIGPSPEHIRLMGDKVRAKEEARRLGIPVVPGSAGGGARYRRGRSGGARDRLSGAVEGVGRRRRARHEAGAQRRRAGGTSAARAGRGKGRVRRRFGLSRTLSRPSPAYRGAADRRRQQARSFISASATARCSARIRRCSKRRRRRRWARPSARRCWRSRSARCANSATRAPARWSSFIRTASSISSR